MVTRLIRKCRIQWSYSLFPFLTRTTLFGTCGSKIRNCLKWNLVPQLIAICRIRWGCSLFLFSTRNTFFRQIYSRKSKLSGVIHRSIPSKILDFFDILTTWIRKNIAIKVEETEQLLATHWYEKLSKSIETVIKMIHHHIFLRKLAFSKYAIRYDVLVLLEISFIWFCSFHWLWVVVTVTVIALYS